MFLLHVTVIHPLGKFAGYMPLNDPEASEEEVRSVSDEMQCAINNLNRLVLTQNDGTEIVFQETIIRGSIFIFDVVEN